MAAGADEQPTDRRERPNRRAEIVQAAFELFSERGFRGASLGAVAARVGLTNAGLLHYFSSKEELLTVVLAERDRETREHAERSASEDGSLHATLEQLRAMVAHNAENAGLVQVFTVLAAESVTDGHPAQEFFRGRYARVRSNLAGALARDPDRPLDDDASRTLANLVIAVMDGLQVQWLLAPDEVDMEAAFALLERLLEGASDRSA
ncbi:AcrR family transcriptional regulator [Motilibacter peucedani]|uniref:AcrR family transcriptional regulator n=1 Tax=Motilibacter peucedani TaxID=598650 RepID=A0A420XQJ9_9ACTN|nr:TetR/AcrR family transcriptional regulator [Motilibacter peucedani]RKS75504.1 AcrR family transcriptional regulator [Motilibacter peucedani]